MKWHAKMSAGTEISESLSENEQICEEDIGTFLKMCLFDMEWPHINLTK